MDILKVYQFTPGFRENRDSFRRRISETLGVTEKEASSYFSIITKLWDSHSSYSLERRRAEWILALNTAIIFLFSILTWLLVGLLQFLRVGGISILIPLSAVTLLFVAARRLLKIAAREREKSDQDFFLIIEQNKETILHSWMIVQKSDSGS